MNFVFVVHGHIFDQGKILRTRCDSGDGFVSVSEVWLIVQVHTIVNSQGNFKHLLVVTWFESHASYKSNKFLESKGVRVKFTIQHKGLIGVSSTNLFPDVVQVRELLSFLE